MEPRKIIAGLAVKHRGDWDKIYQELVIKEFDDERTIERYLSTIRCDYITIFDKEYPQYLKDIYHPPFVLFYRGDISLIDSVEHNLAVIGSREPTIEGLINTNKMIRGLRPEIVIVSGLAKGIDGEAHESAINSRHRTIAVLGSDVDMCYPNENNDLYSRIKRDRSNLIISEYPTGVSPNQNHFPARNRLISAFSKRLLVTEARVRSGTTITMSYAITQNKDVLCIPSADLGNSACNLCIKDGGFLVETSEDVNAFYWR